MKVNDTAKITIDLFCHLGHAFSERFNDGDPLGTGGKISGTYNAFLYAAAAGGYPTPSRTDNKIKYGDFGYIPLWQPNNFSGRVGYRFLPTLLGRVTLGYTLDQSETTTGNQFALGELLFKWTPRKVNGLGVTVGRLLWTGSYAEIFDQMPLEQFAFDGTILSYSAEPTKEVSINSKIGFGNTIAGRSDFFSDTTGYKDIYYQYQGEIWRRLHCLGSFTATFNNSFSVKAIGGYQRVPQLETEVKIGSQANREMNLTIPESDGWHVGLELNGTVRKSEHFITLALGKNDVLLGWSAPPYIDSKECHTITLTLANSDFGIHNFSRKGCSLLHGAWWMNLRRGRLRGSTGVWASYSVPSDVEAVYIFEDIDIENNYRSIYDTVSVGTRRSLSAKGAFDFSYRTVGPFHLGLRGDIIHYNNPEAHSNVFEFWRNVNDYYYLRDHPAKWDYEAVNCRIVTPYFLINVANMLHIKAAYAFAFYDKKVFRQRRNASTHGNLVLSTQLNWRFAKMKRN